MVTGKILLAFGLSAVEAAVLVYILCLVWLSAVWVVPTSPNQVVPWGRLALRRSLRGAAYGLAVGVVLFALNAWCFRWLSPEYAVLARSAGAWAGVAVALAAMAGAAQFYFTKASSFSARTGGVSLRKS